MQQIHSPKWWLKTCKCYFCKIELIAAKEMEQQQQQQLFAVLIALLVPGLHVSNAKVTLRSVSNLYLPYAYESDGVTGIYGIDKDAVEQSAYDVTSGLVYAAGEYRLQLFYFIIKKVIKPRPVVF